MVARFTICMMGIAMAFLHLHINVPCSSVRQY